MPNEKVELAIYDNDLKCRTIKKYEVSDDGTQIRVKSGGEGHFMPKFDNHSYLEIPTRKRYFLFGAHLWKRLYFVHKKGEKCVNFFTGESFGPNPEEQKIILGSNLLGQIGKVKQDTPMLTYFIVLLLLGIIAKVFGVI